MSLMGSINVINRKGETIPMKLETISKRLTELAEMEPKLNISTDYVASKTAASLINGIKTSDIDNISAGICASLIADDYEYDTLASRIIISSLHKTTYSNVLHYAKSLKSYTYRNNTINILHPKTIEFIYENDKELNELLDYTKDYTYNYFGAITLINSYLLSYKYDNNVKIVKERPQQMLLRVAIGIHLNNINNNGTCNDHTFNNICNTYKLLSDKYYTHATPTLFNAGTINHTLSSCYLLSVDDNLENIYQRLSDISKISKFSGGVGIHVSQVRAQGSVISSTIGRSEGLVPMLKVYNESTKYVSQGGGKRKGSTAVYIEPWHADIESCIMSQKQQGIPEKLCRDLFLALWVPDLFMERLKTSIKEKKTVLWSLMCPNECKGLTDVYGEEFKYLYEKYEKEGKFYKQIPIQSLWNLIVSTQIETGKPYLMYKDHVNRKCNQNNLGTIKSSNLCVHGDTKILTYQGYKCIKDLDNQLISIWNGYEWSLSKVKKTNENQPLLKIITSDGCELLCTKEHQFKLSNGKIVHAKDLKINNSLMKCNTWPSIDGNQEYNDNKVVPINASIQNKRKWLYKYIEHNQIEKDYGLCIKMLEIDCSSYEQGLDIKFLCNTLGFSPNLIKDEYGYLIRFSGKDVFYMYEIMKLPNKSFKIDEYIINSTNEILITSIEEADGLHDTYCFNEPTRHMGIFNGLLTCNCSEITIYSDSNEIGVCNLASICLPKFITTDSNGIKKFDYKLLEKITQNVVINMNQVIKNNKYPVQQAKDSDDKHAPIGIGVQGLSDVFMILGESYDSENARKINSNIFETIYFGALTASNKLAQIEGSYKSFRGSMTYNGILQFDLWDNQSLSKELNWNWDDLRHKITFSGLANSLLLTIMPTAGTSIIMGFSESVEVPTSNLFTRSTLSGRFQVVNKHLMYDLKKIGLWNSHIKEQIIQNDGSIQSIKEIPENIKNIYRTVYEYKISSFIEMCADRERFVCQSSSNNRYISDPSISKITKLHLYSWKLGLKTSSYYIRCKQLVTGKKLLNNKSNTNKEEDEVCLSCTA